jgi:hypothetical protein
MADDHTQRQYRSNEYPPAQGRATANDPLAELARLIGQSDPFAEFGRRQPQPQQQEAPQQQWAPQAYAAPAYEQPAAPPPPQAYESAAPAYEDDGYYANDGYAEAQPDYDDVPPPRRRLWVIGVAAVLALAVVGTAGAFGYRALFGSTGSSPPPVIKADATPTKVVPPSKSASASNKLIYDRVGERGAGEKLVSREEQPVDIGKATQQASLLSGNEQPAPMPGAAQGISAADQPKKVHTIVIRPDQTPAPAEPPSAPPQRAAAVPTPEPAPAPPPRANAPQRLASAPPVATASAAEPPPATHAAARPAPPPRNAPLSLNPNAQAASPPPAPVRTASVPPAHKPAPVASSSGQYAVQISSQRSEAEAQAAFRALQSKYPTQLGGRSPIIRRADLGSKGIYYRAMVGPFASSGAAGQLCQSLKAAGGSCLIQKN